MNTKYRQYTLSVVRVPMKELLARIVNHHRHVWSAKRQAAAVCRKPVIHHSTDPDRGVPLERSVAEPNMQK
jgi:hypothetical protein